MAFIVGVNLKRRHLDIGQKIALGLEIEPHFAAEAKARQTAALKRGDKKPVVENVPQREDRSRDRAAKTVGVSGKTLSAAKLTGASPRYVSDAKMVKAAKPE